MEFTAITTQEQFDAAIAERLRREKETVSKKYEDYDTLKAEAIDYQKQIGELGKSIKASEEKYAGYDKSLIDLQKQVKSYETNAVKMRIAHESGISYELAGRLSGDTEDDIRKDAVTLSKLIGGDKVAPLKTTEQAAGDDKKAAMLAFTQNLTKGD